MRLSDDAPVTAIVAVGVGRAAAALFLGITIGVTACSLIAFAAARFAPPAKSAIECVLEMPSKPDTSL